MTVKVTDFQRYCPTRGCRVAAGEKDLLSLDRNRPIPHESSGKNLGRYRVGTAPYSTILSYNIYTLLSMVVESVNI